MTLFDLLEFECDVFNGRQNTQISVSALKGYGANFSITNIPWSGSIMNEVVKRVSDTSVYVAEAYGGSNVRVIRGVKL